MYQSPPLIATIHYNMLKKLFQSRKQYILKLPPPSIHPPTISSHSNNLVLLLINRNYKLNSPSWNIRCYKKHPFPGNHDQAPRKDPECETSRKEEADHEREDPRKGTCLIVFVLRTVCLRWCSRSFVTRHNFNVASLVSIDP